MKFKLFLYAGWDDYENGVKPVLKVETDTPYKVAKLLMKGYEGFTARLCRTGRNGGLVDEGVFSPDSYDDYKGYEAEAKNEKR